MELSYEDLEELCETVGHKIKEANDKVRMSNGDLSGGDVEYLDKLTHTLKSIKTIIAMMDKEGYSGYDGRTSGRYNQDGYYSRGRSGRRDTMSRYPRRGYSGADNSDMIDKLREMMDDAPDEKIRNEIQRLVTKMENM